MTSQPWIVIPTYNEKSNISRLVPILFQLGIPNLSVLIVDDSSPDGTAQAVKEMQQKFSALHLKIRPKKSGLGQAYIDGFGYATTRGATGIVQMDADFSHDPHDVPRLLVELDHYDLVIGSRYSDGISIINWPLRRLILSVLANKYASVVTGLPIHDSTGGFKAWRITTLAAINFTDIKAEGYGFQIVITYRAWHKHLRIKEIPIIFTERREGQSKMSKSIIWEALWLVWRLRLFE
jgi:dolichol-phosphate mannosyltransferase